MKLQDRARSKNDTFARWLQESTRPCAAFPSWPSSLLHSLSRRYQNHFTSIKTVTSHNQNVVKYLYSLHRLHRSLFIIILFSIAASHFCSFYLPFTYLPFTSSEKNLINIVICLY